MPYFYYVDGRFGRKGEARYAYLFGLLGQAVITVFFLFMAIRDWNANISEGLGPLFYLNILGFFYFGVTVTLHLRATLRARRLIQQAEVDGDHVWVRCMFGRELVINLKEIYDFQWLAGRDWFNFLAASYMDNPGKNNIVLTLRDGNIFYIFNDDEGKGVEFLNRLFPHSIGSGRAGTDQVEQVGK